MLNTSRPKEKPAGAGNTNGVQQNGKLSNGNIATPVGDVNAKLSIAYAMDKGYQILLYGDGEAQIIKPAGEVYHVNRFECDCPDKLCRGGSHHGRCKHEHWVSQLRPCDYCGSVMGLVAFRTCFGEGGRRFECPTCCSVWEIGIVRAERRLHMATGEPNPKLTAQGRCKQAIFWMQQHNRDHFVWRLLEQSPHMASLMVQELAIADAGKLADQVAKKYGLPGERGQT